MTRERNRIHGWIRQSLIVAVSSSLASGCGSETPLKGNESGASADAEQRPLPGRRCGSLDRPRSDQLAPLCRRQAAHSPSDGFHSGMFARLGLLNASDNAARASDSTKIALLAVVGPIGSLWKRRGPLRELGGRCGSYVVAAEARRPLWEASRKRVGRGA